MVQNSAFYTISAKNKQLRLYLNTIQVCTDIFDPVTRHIKISLLPTLSKPPIPLLCTCIILYTGRQVIWPYIEERLDVVLSVPAVLISCLQITNRTIIIVRNNYRTYKGQLLL